MKKFETNKSYYCRSACQSDCIWKFKVLSRTEKRMKIEDVQGLEHTKTVGIQNDGVQEFAFPFGKFSLCPILRAERQV